MYFSMIKLRRNLAPHEITDLTRQNGYHAHQLVWKMFADNPDRQRDFLYRHESVNGLPTFYIVANREPVNNSELWDIRTKEYKPQLRPEQRLGFTLSANPIRSRRDENGRQHRHDVVMEAKLNIAKEGKSFDLSEIVQEHGFRWLEERSAFHGFKVLRHDVRVDGYQQRRLFKRKGDNPISFSTMDFNGILAVTEPDVFIEKCLFSGIGSAKGFGCGLMLVRKI